MTASSQKRYGVHEFARLGGATVKALHHYDRLGLLKPMGQSGTGYRLYTGEDFVTLKQIVALEYFGFTVEEINRLITGANLAVARALLEQKQQQLGQVIRIFLNNKEGKNEGEISAMNAP